MHAREPGADASFDKVILIDRRDRAVGTADKLEAHRRGLRHRAISVIVRDTRGRLLLQKRAAGKYHSGGLWTNTCCTHPRPGETVAHAASRRLVEEMGILAPLLPLFSLHYRARVSEQLVEHELVYAFGGACDAAPSPDPSEVADWRWAEMDEILSDVERRPQAYTVWFRMMLREFQPEIAGFARQCRSSVAAR